MANKHDNYALNSMHWRIESQIPKISISSHCRLIHHNINLLGSFTIDISFQPTTSPRLTSCLAEQPTTIASADQWLFFWVNPHCIDLRSYPHSSRQYVMLHSALSLRDL